MITQLIGQRPESVKPSIEAIDFLVKEKGFDPGILWDHKFANAWTLHGKEAAVRLEGTGLTGKVTRTLDQIAVGPTIWKSVIVVGFDDPLPPEFDQDRNRLVICEPDDAVIGVAFASSLRTQEMLLVPSAAEPYRNRFFQPNPERQRDLTQPRLRYNPLIL